MTRHNGRPRPGGGRRADRGERPVLHDLAVSSRSARLRIGLDGRPSSRRGTGTPRRPARRGRRAGLQLEPDARLGRVEPMPSQRAAGRARARTGSSRRTRRRGPRGSGCGRRSGGTLGDEPRLADARLADDRMMAPRPSKIARRPRRAPPARSRGRPARTAARTGPARAPVTRSAATAAQAPQLDLAERSSSKSPPPGARFGADHDAAVGGDLLQPRGDVDGVAERVEPLGAVAPRRSARPGRC